MSTGMEYFEKAHTPKNAFKSSKSEQNLKKELKHMLYGYKLNDKDIIKKSSVETDVLEDIVSVSGYSDVENVDESKTQNLQSSEVSLTSPTVASGSPTMTTDSDSPTNAIQDVIDLSSEAASLNDNSSFTSDESSLSFIEVENETDLSNSDSQESKDFDPEGTLAAKIHSVINTVKPKDSETCQTNQTQVSDMYSFLSSSDSADSVQSINDPSSNLDNPPSSDRSRPSSPPFVSVETKAVPTKSIGQILGVSDNPSQNPRLFNGDTNIFSCDNYLSDKTEIKEASETALPESSKIVFQDNAMFDSTPSVMESPHNDDINMELEQSDETEISDDEIVDWTDKIKVYNLPNACVVILKHPAEIYVRGKVKVKSLCGSVEIYGYTLQENFCDVYAPNYNHALALKTVEVQHAFYGLFGKLTNAGISVANAEEIILEVRESDAVIHLKPLNCSIMEFVEKNFTSVDLFRKPSRYIEPFLLESSRLLSCSLSLSKPWKCFEENSNWKQVMQYGLKNRSCGMVCGGKGAGKSTFLRYCVNKLLTQGPVLVIDLDPGQCEFTVPGNLSAVTVTKPLIGPNYTHLTTPDRCINIGMINVMDNMSLYLNGVTRLIDYCLNNKQYSDVPWVVNTMGMCNSAGLKLITYSILKIKPTYLLQIDSKNYKNRFECYLNAHTIKQRFKENYRHTNLFRNVKIDDDMDYNFFVSHQYTDSNNKSSGGLAPRVFRDLNYLAYFGQLTLMQPSQDILTISPFRVKLSNFKFASNIRLNRDNVFRIINGKIIALCQQIQHDNSNQMFTLQDKPLICHGHGLVRGIEPDEDCVYIVTPVPNMVLPVVDTFVYADWVPELRGYETQLPPEIKVPYRMESLQQHKNLMTAPKRRFNPIQFIRESKASK